MANLYFFYAAMNAGKTTSLLQTDYNYRERGMNTLIFNHSLYTSHSCGVVISRIGLEKQAITYDKDFDFLCYIRSARDVSCILVDEAQFLTAKQVDQLGDVVDSLNIPVLTYGLRTDFLGNSFEGSSRLLAIADILTELKTVCYCGRKATMNMRVDKDGNKVEQGEQIDIEKDQYISVCRRHFKHPEELVKKSLI